MSDAVTSTPSSFSITVRAKKGLKAKHKDNLATARERLTKIYGDTVTARTSRGKKPKLEESAKDAFKALSKDDQKAIKKYGQGDVLIHVTQGDEAISKKAGLMTVSKKGKVKKIKGDNSRKDVLRKTAFKKGGDLKSRAKTKVYNAEKGAERVEIRAAVDTIKEAGGKMMNHAKKIGNKLANGKGLGAVQDGLEKLLKHLEKFTPEVAASIRKGITKAV